MGRLEEKLRLIRPIDELEAEAFDRAVRGAKGLEADKPGSVAKLNRKSLNVGSSINCPAGQVYGDYFFAPKHLRDQGVENGFVADFERGITNVLLSYMWETVILAYVATG